MAAVEITTILITDLVGSTSLESRVGPARAHEVRREYFDVLGEVVERTGGRAVKNTGDGLMVAFSSASSAVACATGMQQLIERRNRQQTEQLHVRIGIGTGEATVEDGDYFGMPSIQAARLCDAASGDGILVSTTTRMMASRNEGLVFEPVGKLDLKGIPEPVEAWQVAWEPLAQDSGRSPADQIPLPPPLRLMPSYAYVGRIGERASLAGWLQEARAGRRRAVFLAGEPGIGKTRLAAFSAAEAHQKGHVILWGVAREEIAVPYAPWIQALGHYVEHAPAQALRAYVERHGGELLRLAPSLGRRVADAPAPRESDSETERYLLFGAVVGLLEIACAHASVVLVLDDLQWCDKPSALLLKHVIEATGHLPLLVVGTYRDSDLAHDAPLAGVLADLRRVEGVERVVLDGLGVDEVAEVMAAAAGHELDALGMRLAAEITQETDGNPFFVGEILKNLAECGALAQGADGRWRLTASIAELGFPESIREVVGRRVERLGAELQEILTAAAVIGREFDVELLARILHRTDDELLDALDAALESSVLTESPERIGRFQFAHALINHTLYEALRNTRRTRLHRRIAESLEQICGEDPGERLGELAYHWSRATAPVDAAKAVDYARLAGERALAQLAPDEALRWFRQALELLDHVSTSDSEQRCDVLTGIGRAQRQIGDSAFRGTLLAATAIADRLGEGQRAILAVLANTRGWHTAAGEVDRERVIALENAIRSASPDARDHARLLGLLASELTFSGDFGRARALSDEACGMARRYGDQRLLAEVLNSVSNALLGTADSASERWALSGELTTLASDLADPQLQFFAALWRASAALQRADRAEFDRTVDRLLDVSEEVGQPTMRWASLYNASVRAHLDGDLAQAEALALKAAGVGSQSGQSDALMIVGVQLFAVRHEQGRLDELADTLAQRAAENPGLPTLQATLAFTYTELGRLDQAAAILQRAASGRFAVLPFDIAWMAGMARYSEVAARLDARGAASCLYDQLLPHRDQIVTSVVTVNGSVERILGVLAATLKRWEIADEHFSRSVQVHERIGAPLFLARTWMNWGRALATAGRGMDTERARDLLSRAAALARTHEGAGIASEAESLLAAQLPA